MQLDTFDYEDLIGDIDTLLRAQDAFTAASIDAACTRSRMDCDTKRAKEERLDRLRTALEAKLKAAITK